MNNGTKRGLRRFGEYVPCDSKTITNALVQQLGQAKTGQRKRLGEILLETGAIAPDDLKEAIQKQRMDRLQSSAVFSGISLDELSRIREWLSEASVSAGNEFITQDMPSNCFYVLVDGHLLVYRRGEYGEEIPLAHIKPGESIGEMGYFTEGYRSASVKALDDSQLLKINYADMDQLFDKAPILARNFLGLMTERLSHTNLHLEETAISKKVTERSLESFSKFLDISEILTVKAGIEGLIQRAVAAISNVMNAERASLFLLDNASGELWSKVAMGLETKEIRLRMGQGVAGWVAQNNESVNIKNAYSDPRFNKAVDQQTAYQTHSILCGPIKNLMGKPIGVIQAINKIGGTFSQQDEKLFAVLAHQSAIAVENFRLYQKVITYHERMALLLDVTTSVAKTLDMDALIPKIVDKISEVLDAERSTLFILDTETDELWSRVAQGVEMIEIRFPSSLGLAGICANTRKVLNISDAYRDPRFYRDVDSQTGFRTHMILCAPIINREGKLIGVIQALNKRVGTFDQEDEGLLKSLASQLTVALENAQLYEDVKSQSERLEKALIRLEMLEKIKLQLSKFVPLSVARQVEQDPEKPDLEKVPMDASILFIDIEKFSKITEQHDQLLVNQMVESHFSAYLDCIRHYGGEMCESSGDGLMVIFKGGSHKDNNENAVAATMEIIANNRKLNEELKFPWGDIKLHLGINSGKAWVGSTKMKSLSGERWVYTASGLATVLAARIGALSHNCRLYVGPETQKCLGESYMCEFIGIRKLKNIKNPVPIYHVSTKKQQSGTQE